jgi:hypothetical protein
VQSLATSCVFHAGVDIRVDNRGMPGRSDLRRASEDVLAE